MFFCFNQDASLWDVEKLKRSLQYATIEYIRERGEVEQLIFVFECLNLNHCKFSCKLFFLYILAQQSRSEASEWFKKECESKKRRFFRFNLDS